MYKVHSINVQRDIMKSQSFLNKSGKEEPMSYLIKDTTEEERRKIVEEAIGNISGSFMLQTPDLGMMPISAAKWNCATLTWPSAPVM